MCFFSTKIFRLTKFCIYKNKLKINQSENAEQSAETKSVKDENTEEQKEDSTSQKAEDDKPQTAESSEQKTNDEEGK